MNYIYQGISYRSLSSISIRVGRGEEIKMEKREINREKNMMVIKLPQVWYESKSRKLPGQDFHLNSSWGKGMNG